MARLNVRLDEADSRRVAALRRLGVQLSRIVREAIRAEHERRLGNKRTRQDPLQTMAEIHATYPDLTELPARDYDPHDRHAARRAILAKLEKRRP